MSVVTPLPEPSQTGTGLGLATIGKSLVGVPPTWQVWQSFSGAG